MTAWSATAVAERDSKFHAEWVPYTAPPPPPGKIFVRSPADNHGRPVCPDLHLSLGDAEALAETLLEALETARRALG